MDTIVQPGVIVHMQLWEHIELLLFGHVPWYFATAIRVIGFALTSTPLPLAGVETHITVCVNAHGAVNVVKRLLHVPAYPVG